MRKYKKVYHIFRISNDTFNPFHRTILQKNTKFLHEYINLQHFFKIANQQPPHQSPPITFQEPTTTPTNSQTINPQSSTRISFQDNPYTFEERHARLSEPLEPVTRQASLSEPQ